MAVRSDDVATSIESHVRETLEKLVGEMRSSVDDIREAVDQQLKAAVQSFQADVSSITFLPPIKKTIGDLENSLKSKEAPSKADVSRVKKAIQSVEQGKSQVDVLNALLEQSVQFGSRAALLILRGETFSGWKGMGFSAAGGNDENVKRFNAAPGLIPELDRVLRYEHVVLWDGNNLATRLGVSGSARAILVPMVIKDKVAAAVYVDAVEDDLGKFDPPSLELLVFTTGLLFDISKSGPMPAIGGEERASTQYVPPAPISRPAAGPASDATKKHDEARRFARLLVSEIKLYNEGKVEQGRKNKDLYERLKEDIDRSRQMYDERIPEDVRKSTNYFYDELVRILADGDAGALGL